MHLRLLGDWMMSNPGNSPPSDQESNGILNAEYVNTGGNISTFNCAYLEVISPKTSTGRLIYAFIRRHLRNFKLSGSYSEDYILNEVYFRAREFILKGGIIINLSPWIKGTGYRVIQELARQSNTADSLDNLTTEVADKEDTTPEDWAEHFAALREAMTQLSPMDIRLLTLKVVKRNSWADIRSVMRIEGHGDAPESTWRKRKERALTRLRKRYHQIKPSL
jgi:hypothetical protein